jgi:hypothetical protein
MERALSGALSEERLSAREPSGLHAGAPDAAEPIPPATREGRWRAPLAIALAAIVIGAAAIAWWIGSRTPPPGESIRFTIAAPPHKLILTDPNHYAISPDGSTLAFIAFDSTGNSLWVRRLGNYQPREIANTRGAGNPFWSPDGKQVGFFSDGKMRRIGLDGGGPQVICDAPKPHGASWGRRGVIVFSPGDANLFRVAASGGTPEPVTTIDTTGGVNAHAWPGFLPDGEHFTYVARRTFPRRTIPNPASDLVRGLDSPEAFSRSSGQQRAMYAPPHHLIYIRNESSSRRTSTCDDFESPIGPYHRRLTGTGHLRRLQMRQRIGERSAGVTSRGSQNNRLVWIDRSGRLVGELDVLPDRWNRPTFSPDGRRVILRKAREDGSNSLWLLDLEREALTQLVSGPDFNDLGAWSPDSREILYSRRGPGSVCEVHRMAVDPRIGHGGVSVQRIPPERFRLVAGRPVDVGPGDEAGEQLRPAPGARPRRRSENLRGHAVRRETCADLSRWKVGALPHGRVGPHSGLCAVVPQVGPEAAGLAHGRLLRDLVREGS